MNAFLSLPETFFITYGDSYLDIDYCNIYNTYISEKKGDCGLMTVFKNEGKWDSSNVIFNNGIIELYSKKNRFGDMNYIDFGLGILSKSNFKDWKSGVNFDLAEIYESLSIQKNLLGFEVYNRFYEIGSFGGIEDLFNYIKTKQ